ncbi:MAG: HAD family hydrolase [Parasphingopyxis sp.]|uniref:HAD family hydrolase n=1 Tax=Parasphingopyxis sp. TaxID=1920299 RepID=UPI003FA0B539
MRFGAIIFDFDGVLIDSEFEDNRTIAQYLTDQGHPTTAEQSMALFMGLAEDSFHDAVTQWIGRPLPEGFRAFREREAARALRHGIDAVRGAELFVKTLDQGFPKAVASSSPRNWIHTHLLHIGLREHFGNHLFSGREDVANGKPAPDLYLHAAEQLGVEIERCAILEDSRTGITGAAASGAYVIGFGGGQHCGARHLEMMKDWGAHAVARSYDEVRALIA